MKFHPLWPLSLLKTLFLTTKHCFRDKNLVFKVKSKTFLQQNFVFKNKKTEHWLNKFFKFLVKICI